MRAIRDMRDFAAGTRYLMPKFIVHGIEGGRVEVTSGDARLIGGDRHGPAVLREISDGLDRLRIGNPLLEGFDVGIAVFVDVN